MGPREAWRLSKTPYVEFYFRSLQLVRGSAQRGFGSASDPQKLVKQSIRSGMINKVTFTLLTCVITGVFLVAGYSTSRTPANLAGSVALSLTFSLAYVLVYLMQVLPSLPSGEAYGLLTTLPLTERDFSLIATFSVVRTFDYIVLGTVITQTAAVAYVTGSLAAAAVMFVASVMNSIFAIAIAVWLSGQFYKNITRGGRSRSGTIIRLLFLLTWGLAVGGIWFSFSLISYILPAVNGVVSGTLSQSGAAALVTVIHPLPLAIAVASAVYGSTGGLGAVAPLMYGSFAAYLVLAFMAGRGTLAATSRMIRGRGVKIIRQSAKDFLLRIRSPMVGYLVKDLRVASKNPSMAFMFALPVLEALVIGLNVFGHALKATSILSMTMMGGFFTLITASALLNTEGIGLEYTLTLPIGAGMVVRAKSVVATATYAPVPLVMTALLAFGRPTSWTLFAIPWLEFLAIPAAASVELVLFIKNFKKKGGSPGQTASATLAPTRSGFFSATGLVRLAGALLLAATVVGGPLLAYGVAYLLTSDHVESVIVLTAVAAAEFLLAQILTSRQ